MKKFFKEYAHHLIWHILVMPALWLLALVGNNYLISVSDTAKRYALLIYINDHPYRMFATIAFVYLFVKALLKIGSALIREKQYAAMLEGIGLREFRPHEQDAQKKEDWACCLREINSTNPTSLQILGATGWGTFASAQSPLHDLLKKFSGHIRILLLKEQSPGFYKRTQELNCNAANYQDEIFDTLDFCKELKTKYQRNVEVRQYAEEPIWKMILTGKYLWLQYYDPSSHVENTPVYTLQTRQDPTLSSLYYPLARVFEKRWSEDTTTPVDLGNWSRRNQANCC